MSSTKINALTVRTLTALLALLLLAAPAAAEPCFMAPVVHVHDGDTITVKRKSGKIETIRVNHIDTPEMAAYDEEGLLRWPDQPWAPVATTAMRGLVLGQRVKICPRFVSYGRLGATVYLRGVEVAVRLASEGLGWVRCRKTCPEARAAADRARELGLGLWADPNPVRPSEWRKGKRE